MKINPQIQQKASPPEQTIRGVLEQRLREQEYNRIHVAMAYVSIAGARALWAACSHVPGVRSQWLVGLDDFVTQPGAVDLVRSLGGAELRVAAYGGRPFRFHPKVCHFQSDTNRDLLIVGSANLTRSALSGNAEAVVFLQSETQAESAQFNSVWSTLWSLGHSPTDSELSAYRESYLRAKPLRDQLRDIEPSEQAPSPRAGPVLERDNVELDPQNATTCWIECGSITAMGRELEFKAEQGLFFGLNPHLTNQQTFNFRVSNGSTVQLRIKYQGNHMWRLQMNNDVPEVRNGLRPTLPNGKLGRSEFVAVFSRTQDDNTYELGFLHLTSTEFADLQSRSNQLGTVGYTTATTSGRIYGWC